MPYIPLDPANAEAAPGITLGAPLTNVGKTLALMETVVTQRLGNRDDLGNVRDLINDAYVDLCDSLDIPVLHASYGFTTVAGQPLYLLHPAVSYVEYVSLMSDNGLFVLSRPLDMIDLDTYRSLPKKDDRPVAFFRHGGMFVLYPTPDEVWEGSIDVKINPLYMTADEHSPIIPLKWHEAIIKLAVAKAHESVIEYDLGAIAENAYTGLVRRKIDEHEEEQIGRVIGSSVPRSYRDLYHSRVRRRNLDVSD